MRPFRWDVTRPSPSVKGLPSRRRMTDRNWYSSRFPSTAIDFPRKASRLVAWRIATGVRLTPMCACRRLRTALAFCAAPGLALAVAFLVGAGRDYVTGQVVHVNDGSLMG